MTELNKDVERLQAIANSDMRTDEEIGFVLRKLPSLLSQVSVMREALEAIRCNTEPNTLGTICDLPDDTAPHTREQHLEAQIRAINWFVRDALSTLPTVGGENVPVAQDSSNAAGEDEREQIHFLHGPQHDHIFGEPEMSTPTKSEGEGS